MKINGIEVQGIRKVHIEYEKGRSARLWNRIPSKDTFPHPDGYGLVPPDYKQDFVWCGHQDIVRYGRVQFLPDNLVLNMIKWLFENQTKYPRLRIKGDTIYVKVDNTGGRLWSMGLL